MLGTFCVFFWEFFWLQLSVWFLLERKRSGSARPLASLTPSFITGCSDPHYYDESRWVCGQWDWTSPLGLIYSLIQRDSNSVRSVSDECVSGHISNRITDCGVLRLFCRSIWKHTHTHTSPRAEQMHVRGWGARERWAGWRVLQRCSQRATTWQYGRC